MNVITKQNVLKAFYQFDKKKMPIMEINGKLSASMDIAMRKRLCDEWLVAFRTVDAVVFDKAAELALASCKKYPDELEMWDFISQAAELGNNEPAEEEALLPTRPAPKKVPEYVQKPQRIAKIIELAKAGRFAEAAQYFKASVEEDEIICYAKEHWPEAEAEWIKKNKDELKELVEQEHICGKCMCLKRCRTNGYRRVGSIDKYTGFLIVKMEICSMKRMEKNAGIQN